MNASSRCTASRVRQEIRFRVSGQCHSLSDAGHPHYLTGWKLTFLLAWMPLSLASTGLAQDCFPSKDSHEAQLFAALAVPLAFSLTDAPEVTPSGRVQGGFEATYLPGIDEGIRTPTTCRPGKGPENTDLFFALPRPRVKFGLPAGFVLEGSWVPPIRLNGVKANLIGLALQRSARVGELGALFMLRIHGTFGLIRAPVTCNDEALSDSVSECFQGTRSDDRYHPNTFGVEGAISWRVGGRGIGTFLGGGLNLLHPRFQVNFTNRFGSTDNRKVEVDLTRGALFAGATWNAATRLALSGEIYGSPGDAVTGRLALSYMIR